MATLYSMTKEKAFMLVRSMTTSLSTATGGSDYRRWRRRSSFSPDWDGRARLIAALVPPNSSVIEFGAGTLALKDFLPRGCQYTPSDLVDRGQGTLVYNLNGRRLAPIPRHDVAVFGGVLEYVHDIPRLISELSHSVECIIASYAVTDSNPDDRRGRGWVNDLSSTTLLNLFAAHGFQMDREDRWGSQCIYRLKRAIEPSLPARSAT